MYSRISYDTGISNNFVMFVIQFEAMILTLRKDESLFTSMYSRPSASIDHLIQPNQRFIGVNKFHHSFGDLLSFFRSADMYTKEKDLRHTMGQDLTNLAVVLSHMYSKMGDIKRAEEVLEEFG